MKNSLHNLELKRLSEINPVDIVALHTDPRVIKQMPLADPSFDQDRCIPWVAEKEQLWLEHGYGPWAFVVNGHFAGWGGLQPELGDADLAMVLHPDFWGLGKMIYDEIIHHAFHQLDLDSITVLLPDTRVRRRGLHRLGFKEEERVNLNGITFHRFRCRNSR